MSYLSTRFQQALNKELQEAYVAQLYLAQFSPLCFAVKEGNIELTKKLIEMGINVNQKDAHGRTALHYAAMLQQKEIIDILIPPEKGGRSFIGEASDALRLAIANYPIYGKKNEKRLFDISKALLDKSESIPNWTDEELASLLMNAIQIRDIDLINKLLAKPEIVAACIRNTKINSLEALGNLLMRAIRKGDVTLIDKLLAKPEIVVAINESREIYPLCGAVRSGNLVIVLELINKGIDINKANKKGHCPLSLAANAPNLEIVHVLLDNRADVSIMIHKNQRANVGDTNELLNGPVEI